MLIFVKERKLKIQKKPSEQGENQQQTLYAVGCTEVHSLDDADSSSNLKLPLEASVSRACGVSLYSNDLVIKYPSMNVLVDKYLPLEMSSCKPATF